MCLSCTVTDIFSVQYWRDLEILVWGQSRSLEAVPFESLGTVSYSHYIATMAVYFAVSTQYTNVTRLQTDSQPDTALRRRLHLGYALHRVVKQELSYRKQIARQLRTQFVEGISVTLKSTLRVTGNGTIGQIIHDLLLDELLDVEYYRYLEMWVRGHSRSLKAVPFES